MNLSLGTALVNKFNTLKYLVMLFTRTSQVSGIRRTKDLPVSEEQVKAYQDGMHIQKAFPHLPSEDREFILSGITKEEWDNLFPEGEE